MAILVDETTRVLFQGFTGSQGTFHSEEAVADGTKMLVGVDAITKITLSEQGWN
jgi:succinyl-CoA synthetase alpha subunit